jgi:hypothetical protein
VTERPYCGGEWGGDGWRERGGQRCKVKCAGVEVRIGTGAPARPSAADSERATGRWSHD